MPPVSTPRPPRRGWRFLKVVLFTFLSRPNRPVVLAAASSPAGGSRSRKTSPPSACSKPVPLNPPSSCGVRSTQTAPHPNHRQRFTSGSNTPARRATWWPTSRRTPVTARSIRRCSGPTAASAASEIGVGGRQRSGAFPPGRLRRPLSSWRGENDNPGQYEMFYGEVDDALAAISYLARLPYVDPSRIYMVGHSTGGTLTLLTAEASTQLRAAFSLGGEPDLWDVFQIGALAYPETPFNWRDRRERRLRSALDYVEHLRTPTWYVEGGDAPDFVLRSPRRMEQRARAAGVPFEVHIVAGGDHFNIVQPIGKLIAQKIVADTGPKCNIAITPAEVTKAFGSR